ncbi:zinc finger protein 2 homolog [Microcaecilia unicolor]|uniref:Zinc finger protein 2 homolog n=1 Tax=Microcaecilia unicolor TaxID=1415580 RepID=A0A6P7XGR9_9AMPH|nr:zinc finger protein 2 homolog [Microcaecilia unicolor]
MVRNGGRRRARGRAGRRGMTVTARGGRTRAATGVTDAPYSPFFSPSRLVLERSDEQACSMSSTTLKKATFDDVAIYFSSEEWSQLDEDQKTIYRHVMEDNYQIMISLGYDIPKPEVLLLMEQGRDPCIQDHIDSARESIDGMVIVSDCPRESKQVASENSYPEIQTRESLPGLEKNKNVLHQAANLKQRNHEHTRGQDLSQRGIADLPNENLSQPTNSTEHWVVHQDNRKKELSECEKKADDQIKPALDHKGEAINQFHIDGKTFIVRSILAEKQKSEEQYKCQQCEKSFSKQFHLTAHERTHRKEKTYQCSGCERSFHHKSGLVAHQRIHSGATPHQCTECQQSFSYKSALIVHRKIHSNKKPQPVQTPQSVQNLQPMQKPQSMEKTNNAQPTFVLGGKPHKCSSCDKRFNDPALLVAHQKVHTEELPHRCSQCPKEFENASLLVVHLRTHMPDKPHKCDHCDKSFNNPLLLVNHKRIHSDESQHPCNQCTKSFNDPALLLAHKKTHTENKLPCGQGKEGISTTTQPVKLPYRCNHCDKSFAYQSLLNEHLKVHVGDKPHKCDHCEKSFNDPALLVAHKKTHSDAKYLNTKPMQKPPQGSQPSITSQKI